MNFLRLPRPLLVLAFLFSLGGGAFSPLRAEDDRPVVDPSKLPKEREVNKDLPTLFIVGDSTVRSGGSNGCWGWGERIAPYLETKKINVVNEALGGRSSRTYETEGRWDRVAARLKKGDVVIIQFGHNDGGRIGDPASKGRASGKGTGPETVEDTKADGSKELVHTFGWYMAKFVTETKSKGATPILCSPVPHKQSWQKGRDFASFAQWDEEVAKAGGALYVDLTLVVTNAYKKIGADKADTFFADKGTHTNDEGAKFNAECVVAGLKSLPNHPLAPFLSEKGKAVPAAK